VLSAEPVTMKRDCAGSYAVRNNVIESLRTLTVNINGPYRAVVTVICPQTLAVVREPHVHGVVFSTREQQISLGVEFDLCQGTLMALVRELVRSPASRPSTESYLARESVSVDCVFPWSIHVRMDR
jgi:hypothetical protein